MAGSAHDGSLGLAYALDCPVAERQRLAFEISRTPALRALQKKGTATLRFFPALLGDVAAYFYQSADLKQTSETGPAPDRFHSLLVKFLCDSAEYRQLRGRTSGDLGASLLAAQEFCERLLACLTDQHRTSAPPSNKPSRFVRIKGVVFGDPGPAGHGPVSDEALLVIARHVEQVIAGDEALSDLNRSWGSQAGCLQQLPYEDRAALARRVGSNDKLRRLAERVGRMRNLALHSRKEKVPDLPHEVYDLRLGNNLSRVLPQELAQLSHPLLRRNVLRRLLEEGLFEWNLRGEEPSHQGALVVCIDTSGSMAGEPEIIAKAIALALLDVAQSQKRAFAGILFSSSGEWIAFHFGTEAVAVREPGQQPQPLSRLEAVVRLGSDFFGGGTDFEGPLREAARIIAEESDGFRRGDVVFISDDYAEVSDAFVEEYLAVKAQRHFRTYSVIIGASAENARVMKRFSDQVDAAQELTEDTARAIFRAV